MIPEAGVMPLLFRKTGKRVAQALEVIYEVRFVYSTFKAHLALHGNFQWLTKTKVIKALEVSIRRLQGKLKTHTSHKTENLSFTAWVIGMLQKMQELNLHFSDQ